MNTLNHWKNHILLVCDYSLLCFSWLSVFWTQWEIFLGSTLPYRCRSVVISSMRAWEGFFVLVAHMHSNICFCSDVGLHLECPNPMFAFSSTLKERLILGTTARKWQIIIVMPRKGEEKHNWKNYLQTSLDPLRDFHCNNPTIENLKLTMEP